MPVNVGTLVLIFFVFPCDLAVDAIVRWLASKPFLQALEQRAYSPRGNALHKRYPLFSLGAQVLADMLAPPESLQTQLDRMCCRYKIQLVPLLF